MNTELQEDIYIQDRVEDQIKWYEGKSASNKRKHHLIKFLEILLAVLMPFLSNFDAICAIEIKYVLALIGLFIAFLTGISSLYKFHDKWIEYRTTVETLKHEFFLYKAHAGIYRQGGFEDFVERFEGHISKENSNWTSIVHGNKDGKNTPQ